MLTRTLRSYKVSVKQDRRENVTNSNKIGHPGILDGDRVAFDKQHPFSTQSQHALRWQPDLQGSRRIVANNVARPVASSVAENGLSRI